MENRRLPSRRAKRGDSPSSVTRKSPQRKASPSRKATTPPLTRKTSPARSKGSPTRTEAKKQLKQNKEEPEDKSITQAKKIGRPKLFKGSTSSTYSVKTTTSTRTVNLSGGTEADAEIARLTNLGQTILNRRSTSKIPTPLHHLTPTPTTEQSRQSRSISRSVYEDDEDNYSRTEYSDNETEDIYKSLRTGTGPDDLFSSSINSGKNIYSNDTKVSSRKIPIPREFGGIFGVLLLLMIVPVLSYYLQWCCSKTSNCEFKKINLTGWNLKYLEKVFDLQTIAIYVGFQLTIFILSSFPLGRVVCLRSDRGLLKFYFNSLTIATIGTIAFLITELYFKYPVADLISKNYLRFCIFAIVNAIIGAFWCYIMSRLHSSINSNTKTANDKQTELTNPYGKSNNFLVDYAVGRDINPKWCGIVDIKLSHYRISLLTMLTIGIVLMLKNLQIPTLPTGETKLNDNLEILKYFYNETGVIDKSALFCTILYGIYVLDMIVFEHHLASSFELQQEGVGALLLLRYAITPFFLASIPKYALEHKTLNLPIWSICLITIIFLIGLLMKRSANGIKYKFRMNPNDVKFLYSDTVPTFQGRRLLCDHLWSYLRQPNYTGDILTLLSMISPIFWKFSYPPFVCILLLIIFLIHRSVRVNARNFDRYSSAWTRYCTKVKHLVVPKVF